MKQLIEWGLLGIMVFALACGTSTPAETDAEETTARVENTPEALLSAYTQQIAQSPKDYSLWESRSQVYFELDSLDQAIADIDQAISLYPTGPELRYWRGFLAYVINDTAKAREELELATGLGTQNPEVFYQLGQIYFLQKRYDEAKAEYEQAAKLSIKDPTYQFALGFLEESRRKHSKAVEYYLEALRIDSTFDKALLRLHDVYLTAYENEAEAMKYNDQLLRNQTLHPLGQYNQGSYHLRKALAVMSESGLPFFQEQVNEAVTAFTLTVNRDPNFVQAWYNRGYCYWLGDGKEEQAIQDFQTVVELDSTQAQAHFMLGSIFEKNGDLATAYTHYAAASRHQPESRDFRIAAEEVSQKIGR
ncbi:MAG: tetratricopeptide repeat protein [Bacteroidota bacterium]